MLFCFFEPFFFFAVFFLLAALHNGIAVAKCSASRNLLSTVGAKTYNTVITVRAEPDTAVRGSDGVWYVDRVGGQLLYDKYRKYTYHEGGIVGGGDIKSNEQLSLLKTKEWVLSEQMVDNLTTQMDRINMLSDAMSDLPDYAGKSTLSDVMKQVSGSKTVNNITNNSRPIEVQIGDTIIHGADQSTVDKHIKVTRDMVNQIGRLIGIGR